VYQSGSAIVVPHCRDMNHWRCRSGLAILFAQYDGAAVLCRPSRSSAVVADA